MFYYTTVRQALSMEKVQKICTIIQFAESMVMVIVLLFGDEGRKMVDTFVIH